MNRAALPRFADMDAGRRRWLQGAAGGALAAWAGAAQAAAASWLPYAPDQTTRIEPVAMRRIEPVMTDFEAAPALRRAIAQSREQGHSARSLADRRLAGLQPPAAYARTGRWQGVPAWLLYGVALQESMLKLGALTLPWPWTLCARGRGLRYASYGQALAALQSLVKSGIASVDCGAMQVNWRWHGDKLGSLAQALDPYPNLAVGARILRGHFEASGDWRSAVALYHVGSAASAAARQRGMRYANQTLARLARMGVNVPLLLEGGGHA